MTQTWFITGSSRGFGRALTVAALEAGDRVAATARNPSQINDLIAAYGEKILPVALDVTDRTAVADAVRTAVDHFGRLDVVVNNAGYANIAAIESDTDEDFRTQFETNFWGVYNVSTAVLPILRDQGSGTIVQFSSIGGRVGGNPGLGSYQAAKFAVDGFTRVLAAETAPHGIRTLVVEPGGFATDWAGSSMRIDDVPAAYDATVGAMARRLKNSPADVAAGDPARAAAILVRLLHSTDLPTHLPLGAGAVQMAQTYSQTQLTETTRWAALSRSADAAQPYPVPLP